MLRVRLPNILLFGGLFFLAACETPPVISALKQRLGLAGEASPAGEEELTADRGATSSEMVKVLSPKERAFVNRAFLLEIYEQVFARPLEDKDFYDRWMNVLSQGASIEGVYRGITLASEYAAMERGVASAAAKAFFVSEVLRLENEVGSAATVSEAMKNAIRAKIDKYSLFTLKRILGEKYLTAIDRKAKNREELNEFYGDTAKRFGELNIDFGYEARNSKDADYHRRWAAQNSLGRIQWETLNRVHRTMNSLGGILIQPKKTKVPPVEASTKSH